MIITKGKNLQEVVDELGKKLQKQGVRCSDGIHCVYSDGKGNRCVVGWLFDNPPTDLEGTLASILEEVKEGIVDKSIFATNEEFIMDNVSVLLALQGLHDTSYKNLFRSRFKEIEKRFPISLKEWKPLETIFSFN